jgi:hypothetical protein
MCLKLDDQIPEKFTISFKVIFIENAPPPPPPPNTFTLRPSSS